MLKYFRLVKFEHSVFALPPAIAALMVATGATFPLDKTLLVISCMVFARTCGMTYNRLMDAPYDALNPRTANREIPRGVVSTKEAKALIIISVIAFFVSAGLLNRICLMLAPLALLVICGYTNMKKATPLCHFVLALSLAIAPAGAWLAVRQDFNLAPVLLSTFTFFWVSGFDIVYQIQDMEFDRKNALHSIPADFGEKFALQTALFLHVLAVGTACLFPSALKWNALTYAGIALLAIVTLSQHAAVRKRGIGAFDKIFVPVNACASLLVLSLFLTAELLE